MDGQTAHHAKGEKSFFYTSNHKGSGTDNIFKNSVLFLSSHHIVIFGVVTEGF